MVSADDLFPENPEDVDAFTGSDKAKELPTILLPTFKSRNYSLSDMTCGIQEDGREYRYGHKPCRKMPYNNTAPYLTAKDLQIYCVPYFSVWCSSGSLTSSSSTRWPKGSEEIDTMLDRMTLLSLLPVRTSWS